MLLEQSKNGLLQVIEKSEMNTRANEINSEAVSESVSI